MSNQQDYFGTTPLMNAVRSDSVRAVAVLLGWKRERPNLEMRNDYMQTAFDFVRSDFVQYMLDVSNRSTGEAKSMINAAFLN